MGTDFLINWILKLSSAESSAFYPLYSFLIHTTVYLTITAVFIILFKLIFKNKLKAKYHFLIWGLLMIRLVVPVLPSSPFSVFNTIMPEEENIRQSSFQNYIVQEEESDKSLYFDGEGDSAIIREPKEDYTENTTETNTDTSKELRVDELVTFIWLGGAIILLGYFIIIYALYKRKLRKSRKDCGGETLKILEECKNRLKVKRKIELYYADTTPTLTGLFKPKIFIPENCGYDEIKSTLLHELNHLKHFDILWSALAAVVLCLNWFNPIIWICFFMFKRDIEVYCDERTLSFIEDKQSYAMLLLNTAAARKEKFVLGTTSLQSGKSDVKRRIKYMAKFKKPTIITLCVAAVIAAGVAVICLTNAVGAPPESNSDILVDIRLNADEVYYNLTVHKDKTFYVRKKAERIDENYNDYEEKDSKNINLSQKQYNSVEALVKGINTVVSEQDYGGGEFGYTYEVSINGENYSEIISYGDSVRSGYDDLLTKLIKLSPIEVVDYYNAKVVPDTDITNNFFLEDKGRNPNITYSYDKNTKTLTFSGKGKMDDYEYMPYWYDVANVDNVVVNEGITRICADAFSGGIEGNSGTPQYDFQYTENIRLPDSVTEIGDEAFSYCYALKELKLPENVRKIGKSAFMECKKLKRIEFPDKIERLSEGLCSYCEKLEEVKFGKNTSIIEPAAFENTNLKNVKLPHSLQKIDFLAFAYCRNLSSVDIPNGVKSIGDDAFFACNLKSVTISSSVSIIGSQAFGYISDNKKVKDFTIKGYTGSAAEKYARKNGFKFVSIGTYSGEPESIRSVVVDYANSKTYTKAEIDSAVKVIKNKFKVFKGGAGTLLELTYKGDDYSESQLNYCNKLRDKGEPKFKQCMVFDSLFHTEMKTNGIWNNDEDYTWSWYLAENSKGKWKLLTFGY